MDPSCAQPSAIGNLLNGVTSSQRQLGDLSLGGAAANINLLDAQKHGGGVDHLHHRMGPSGPVHSDISHFINAFDKGPQLERPMHPMAPYHPMMHHPPPFAGSGPMQQMQRPPMMHAPPSADSLVAEFAQVNMQDQFERLYAAPPHQGQPQHAMPAPQAAAWTAEFEQRQRHMQHIHHMNQQHFRTPFQPQTSVSGQWVDEFDDVNSFVKQQEQKHHQQTFEDVYQQTATPQVQGDGWANEFEQEQKANVGMGMGMGMDKDTIEKLMNSDDPKWRNSKFLKFIKQISSGEVEFRDNQVVPKQPQAQDWAAEFAANDQAAQRAMEQQAMPQGVDWASEFAQGVDDDAWAAEYDADVKNDWASQFSQEQMAQGEAWANEFMREQRLQGEPYTQIDWVKAMEEAKHGVTPQKDPEYEFAQENPFRDHANPYEEGIRLLENGKLKQAILAFEAEVQRNPENAEAWRYLGQAQAENESETHAIAALLKAVHHDPYNLKALMMLGVSYTNDLEEKRALNYLKTWITNHPDYQQSSMAQHKAALEEYENLYSDPNHQSPFDANLHQEVTRLFHNAVQINSRDPELHTVLGVLYHISNDFDKSIEEFKQALKLRPDDPQLWNKLGATQANSSRSAEAVHAYRRALQLRPTYVRASANLAISFANQGLHEDAVRMYLSTLAQNPDANHIWAYLRISLSHLNKDDLVELTQRKNPELFRPYYQF